MFIDDTRPCNSRTIRLIKKIFGIAVGIIFVLSLLIAYEFVLNIASDIIYIIGEVINFTNIGRWFGLAVMLLMAVAGLLGGIHRIIDHLHGRKISFLSIAAHISLGIAFSIGVFRAF